MLPEFLILGYSYQIDFLNNSDLHGVPMLGYNL